MIPPDTALVGIDWGTSALRVHLVDARGHVLETRRCDVGILGVPAGGFETVLLEQAGDWLAAAPDTPVLACGMVGSRQGWREVPYRACPATVADLAAGLVTVRLPDGRPVQLVPGVALRAPDGVPDVIRGEETHVAGAAAALAREALVCLPGTHVKWAHVRDGTLTSFRTAMSGEVYQVMMEHSILGRMAQRDAGFQARAFRRGVARAASPGGLLHHLFSARTLRLFDELGEDEVGSYLSGVIVGADVTAMAGDGASAPVTLVGQGGAARAYALALEVLGRPVQHMDGDAAVAAGLAAVARAATLLG